MEYGSKPPLTSNLISPLSRSQEGLSSSIFSTNNGSVGPVTWILFSTKLQPSGVLISIECVPVGTWKRLEVTNEPPLRL